MDESVISVLFFIIFGIASVVGKVMKKNPQKQSSTNGSRPQGSTPNQKSKSTALKDLISSIGNELAGQPSARKSVVKPVSQPLSPIQNERDTNHYSAKHDDNGEKIIEKKKISISQSDLKRAFVMKEILDRPLSLR